MVSHGGKASRGDHCVPPRLRASTLPLTRLWCVRSSPASTVTSVSTAPTRRPAWWRSLQAQRSARPRDRRPGIDAGKQLLWFSNSRAQPTFQRYVGGAHRVVEPVAYVIGRMVAVRGPLRCLDDRRLAEHALEAATSRACKQLVTSTRTKSVGPSVVVIASPFGVVAPLSVARATRSSAPTLALSRQADPTERGSCR